METLKRFWNWLLGKTTIDERIEETVDNAKRTIHVVKERVEDVKEEISEAVDAVEDAVEQVKDVFEAANGKLIEGKVTKSKLNAVKKSDLLKHAQDEFGEEFDSKIKKSTLVNKIYGLHKGK
jgi:anion-transporting  ArsA/GET3 family ATPase